ncbi:uncharacterized protein LOC143288753 [Babylonia areolata]|uniref:uncharacterized protein LOC143288753 n=1 Tax=Babylonia areolata TaxID=304850 RepID=UPI003FD32923
MVVAGSQDTEQQPHFGRLAIFINHRREGQRVSCAGSSGDPVLKLGQLLTQDGGQAMAEAAASSPSFALALSSLPPPPATTEPHSTSLPPPPSSLSPRHPDVTFWRERVTEWYPRWREKPIFIPPVQLNRTFHSTQTVLGQDVTVQDPPPLPPKSSDELTIHVNSDVREDKTQQKILLYLHQLCSTSQEAMLVLSQLRYEDYLNEPSFHAAAKTLPRCEDLKEEGKARGDFDILLIHRQYGIGQIEIKAVGDLFPIQSLTVSQEDQFVGKRVKRAIRQLMKGRDVLRHLVKDVQHSPLVHSSLMLPHVSRTQLQRVLEARPELKQNLCDCVGVPADKNPVDLCVTSDMLPPVSAPYEITDDVMGHLTRWWASFMATEGKDPAMTEDLYLELLARFAGPATTVRVFQNSAPRLHISGGQGVRDVGDRFTRVMLTQRQVGVLQADLPLVFLTGPPGTGKTLMLVVRAGGWLRAGEDVHVVSTWFKSLAATCSIVQQLRGPAGEEGWGRVHEHKFPLCRGGQERLERSVTTLTAAAADSGHPSRINVIVDEVYFDCNSVFSDFCNALHNHFGAGLRLWAASVTHEARPKPPMEVVEVRLTEPLRTPPAVTREVVKCDRMRDGTVYGYTEPSSPLPSDGPEPRFLRHEGEGHSEGPNGPLSCRLCGQKVAKVLVEDLGVGLAVLSPHKGGASSLPALQHRDVVVLISRQPRGERLTEGVGLVQGLRDHGLPVTVLGRRNPTAVERVARMEGDDEVVVAEQSDVYGLERRVVVWLQTARALPEGGGPQRRQDRTERWGRLYAMSRCSGQLVCVMWPAPAHTSSFTASAATGAMTMTTTTTMMMEEEEEEEGEGEGEGRDDGGEGPDLTVEFEQ